MRYNKMKVHNQLNPVAEIIGLTNYIYVKEDFRRQTIRELDELGLQGEKIYDKEYGLIELYAADFASRHVPHPDEPVLFRADSQFCVCGIQAAILENPDWLENIEGVEEAEIRRVWSEILCDSLDIDGTPSLDSPEDRVAFLQKLNLSDGAKWNAMLLFNEPKRYTVSMVQICRDNREAFDYAYSCHQKEIDSLLADFAGEGAFHKSYSDTLKAFPEVEEIYPFLICPLTEWVLLSKGFYGLLIDRVFNRLGLPEQEREQLLSAMKPLSDKSKFEILCLLKDGGPKYNLEIAEAMGISAATASHHMSILLSSDFVAIEKSDGKVFYRFEPKQIEKIIQLLQNQFLM